MPNIYEIATKISMVNAVSPVLAIIAKEVLNLEGSINKLQGALGGLRGKLAIGGGLAMTGGIAIAVGLKAAADHAKDLSHELVQIQKLNISADQLAQVRARAIEVTRQVPGVTQVDALKTYGESYSIFGHEGALGLMKSLNEFAQVAGNTSGNYEKASHNLYEMIRAGDLMGKFVDETTHKVDTAKLQKFLDLGSKVILGTHGKVDAHAWFQLAQQGGPALSGMSDKGMLTMAIASQAMGGARAGTALTSLYQQIVGGRGAQYAAEKMKELGLMDGFTVGRGGHLTWAKGALDTPFATALKEDPLKAVGMMKEALEKHGYGTIEKQVPQLFEMLGRQTTQRLIHDLLRNYPQIMAERERISGALGVQPSKQLADNQDYLQAEQNMHAAWQKLMEAIAGPNAENAIRLMNALTNALDTMTKAVQEMNPETLKNIGIGLAALSAAFIGGGAVALLAALGPGGWLIAGLTALGTAAALHKKGDWLDQLDEMAGVNAVREWGERMRAMMPSRDDINKALEAVGKALNDAIASIPGMVMGAISGMASAIGSALKRALSFGTPSGGVGDGGESMGGNVLKQSFKPAPPRNGNAYIHNVMHLNGRVIHDEVVKAEYRASEHSRQAPAFDGYRHYIGPDGHMWDA